MRVDLAIEPESEVEQEFMENLAAIRNEALDEGMGRQDLSRVLSVYAQALMSDSFREDPDTTQDEDVDQCPDCGSLIQAVEVTGVGEDVEVIPCGCNMPINELPDTKIQDILK